MITTTTLNLPYITAKIFKGTLHKFLDSSPVLLHFVACLGVLGLRDWWLELWQVGSPKSSQASYRDPISSSFLGLVWILVRIMVRNPPKGTTNGASGRLVSGIFLVSFFGFWDPAILP